MLHNEFNDGLPVGYILPVIDQDLIALATQHAEDLVRGKDLLAYRATQSSAPAFWPTAIGQLYMPRGLSWNWRRGDIVATCGTDLLVKILLRRNQEWQFIQQVERTDNGQYFDTVLLARAAAMNVNYSRRVVIGRRTYVATAAGFVEPLRDPTPTWTCDLHMSKDCPTRIKTWADYPTDTLLDTQLACEWHRIGRPAFDGATLLPHELEAAHQCHANVQQYQARKKAEEHYYGVR